MPGCKRPYGVVQTEYVEVPDALLAKTAEMTSVSGITVGHSPRS
jgi:hypothetical protein